MLRWLKPENDRATTPGQSGGHPTLSTLAPLRPDTLLELKKIANSRIVGIWQSKRAKIILGAQAGRTVEQLVLDVRVPPESVIDCLNGFGRLGMNYFLLRRRRPTRRETAVEEIMALFSAPPPPDAELWQTKRIKYIGKWFTAWEIYNIKTTSENHPEKSRLELSREICRMLENKMPRNNLTPKQMAEILKRMWMDNIVLSPYPPSPGHTKASAERIAVETPIKREILNIKASKSLRLSFVPPVSRTEHHLWNQLIAQYHYIGPPRMVGPQVRYFVYGEPDEELDTQPGAGNNDQTAGEALPSESRGQLLALLGFSCAAWRLACRDLFIGWDDATRGANLKRVVNNSRFLILPWIKAPNLASRILSGIARQIPTDWKEKYGYKPSLLETFVNMDLFSGTCYLAANWIKIGQTSGYSLFSSYKARTARKMVLVYPLCKDFKAHLKSPNVADSR